MVALNWLSSDMVAKVSYNVAATSLVWFRFSHKCIYSGRWITVAGSGWVDNDYNDDNHYTDIYQDSDGDDHDDYGVQLLAAYFFLYLRRWWNSWAIIMLLTGDGDCDSNEEVDNDDEDHLRQWTHSTTQPSTHTCSHDNNNKRQWK